MTKNPPSRRVTVYDVEHSLREAGLVRVGGGARNTYYGLEGQKVGVGFFIKLMPKKVALVERVRGRYGRTMAGAKLEDNTHEAYFYGALRHDQPDVYSTGESLRGWLERRAEGTSRKKEFDALSQEYLKRWRKGGSITAEELRDLAVAYRAAYGERAYGVQPTFEVALRWADEIDKHGGEVTRDDRWEGPDLIDEFGRNHRRMATFAIDDLLQSMAKG